MGVIGLTSFIKNKHNENCMRPVNLSEYSGKVIAIDFYNFLFKILRTNSENYMLDILKFIGVFTSNNVIPLFVMDGKPPITKRDCIRERCLQTFKASETAKKIEGEISQLKSIIDETTDNIEDINRRIYCLESQLDNAEKHSLYIGKTHRDNLLALFAYLEIPVCKIDNVECDMVCKYIVNYGIAEACITNDSDIILLGCKNVILDFNYRRDKVNSTPSKSIYTTTGNLVNYDNLLFHLGLTTDEFVEFCICLGTDMNSRIANIPTYDVYSMIKEYHNIENIISHCSEKNIVISEKFKYEPTRKFLATHIDINLLKKNIFNLKSIVDETDFDGEWENPSVSISAKKTKHSINNGNQCIIIIPLFENGNLSLKCDKNTHIKYTNTIKLLIDSCAKNTSVNYIKYSIYCSGYLC